jgi:hypothetical protein
MSTENISLAISLAALFLSLMNVGWSVYKELGLRARLLVEAELKTFHTGDKPPEAWFVITVHNAGPGRSGVKEVKCVGRSARVWPRRDIRSLGFPLCLHEDASKLPTKLDVGETSTYFIPVDSIEFLATQGTHIGVQDTFGRSHWAPEHSLAEALKWYRQIQERGGDLGIHPSDFVQVKNS